MLFRHARAGVPELLQPHPSQAMRTYWVSMAVNNVKNYGPECIESA
jgi:putative SOS response-associated peptidase YedK